ncbi:MAG: glycosyltransferase involved in cell wall biosynthesis [Bacteroidia bacterium]|jgi:glycosyltransferase involved in cell wall biosynthesis
MTNSAVIAGNFFVGKNNVLTQGQILAEALAKKGVQVYVVSKVKRKILRLCDFFFKIVLYRFKTKTIVVQMYSGPSLIQQYVVILCSRMLNYRVSATLHGGAFPQRMNIHPKRYRFILGLCHELTVPSGFIQDFLKGHQLSAQVIPNIINLSDYPFKANESQKSRQIWWMRAYHDIYNPALAVDVLEALNKSSDVKFKMVMCGPDLGEYNAISKRIEAKKLTSFISQLQRIELDQKIKLAEASDLYLCTNRIDNAPVSLVEMMALGLPVISTKVGGIPFLVQHKVSAMLAIESAEELANCILELYANEELWENLRTNGLLIAQKHDEEQVVEQWLNLFSAQ